jgi:hypothetical protein
MAGTSRTPNVCGIYQSDPDHLYTTAIPTQVAVMEYVLDTYLPWDTLAGPSGRFIEQNGDSANYANNETFYNVVLHRPEFPF